MDKKYQISIVVEDFEGLGPKAIKDCFEQMFGSLDAAPFGFNIKGIKENEYETGHSN